MARQRYRRKHEDVFKEYGHKNTHHILAKSRHGKSVPSNLIEWDINTHKCYHYLFGNMTLLEASAWLVQINERHIQNGEDLDIVHDRYSNCGL